MNNWATDQKVWVALSGLFEDLQIVVTTGPLAVRIRVSGELDLVSVGVLREVLSAAVAAAASDVELDMSSTDFCDSVGLCALVEARQQLFESGRVLRVASKRRVWCVACWTCPAWARCSASLTRRGRSTCPTNPRRIRRGDDRRRRCALPIGPGVAGLGADAVAEQWYDELFARAHAVRDARSVAGIGA